MARCFEFCKADFGNYIAWQTVHNSCAIDLVSSIFQARCIQLILGAYAHDAP